MSSKNPNELVLPKERTISARDDKLGPCWIHTETPKTELKKLGRMGERLWQPTNSGELKGHVIALLDKATEIVCASSFLIADHQIVEALLRASKRGLRVYLLTAPEVILLNDASNEDDFEGRRLQDHKEILEQLAGRVLIRTSTSFHSKFIICDPMTPETKGILLTSNLNEEALVRNQEIAVDLNNELSNDLYRQFLIGFWNMAENELLGLDNLSKVQTKDINSNISTPDKILCTTDKIHTIREKIQKLIKESRSEIIISTFGIDRSHEVSKVLINEAREKKRIRIITRPRPRNMQALIDLLEAGAEVEGLDWLHGKAVLVDGDDGPRGLVTTSNFEAHGLDEGYETGVYLVGKEALDLQSLLLQDWWQSATWKLVLNPSLSEAKDRILLWRNNKLVRLSIQAKIDRDLGELRANSFEEMDSLEPKSYPRPSFEANNTLYRDYHYRWNVLPPTLPPDTKKTKEELEFPIYTSGNERFVPIRKRSELQRAQDFAKKNNAKVVAYTM